MQIRITEDSTSVPRQDFPILTTAMPIGGGDRAIAAGVVIFLLTAAAVTFPFAAIPLPHIDVFLPVLQAILCVIDLVTAAFLFGQFSILPRWSLLAIASGYLFSGLFAFAQALAFPGGYSATGLIGDGVNSAAWLFILWHSSFDLSVIVYVLSKSADGHASVRSSAITIALTIACVLASTAGLIWMTAQNGHYLPILFTGLTNQTSTARILDAFLWLMSTVALSLLFVRRRTILDLWLMVILLAWWPNFMLPIFTVGVRFTLGWYAGRGFALIASSTLLIVLLVEATALYARLANALLLLRRERVDRLMSIEAATSAIAHEIKQPLTGIAAQGTAALTWLDRLPARPELGQVRRSLDSMIGASHRITEIIDSICAIFKPSPSRRTAFQLNDVVREVLRLARHELEVSGISVTTEFGQDLPRINVDHIQIQRVILNLIRNAIDAMHSAPPGAKYLRIATGLGEELLVTLRVEDTGPGISVADRDRIFEPFFTTKPTGTGLGLSICRTIIEKHGGILRLADTDTRGSSFEMTFTTASTAEHFA